MFLQGDQLDALEQQSLDILREARVVAYGHKSHVVWLTGVPGVGESTLARYLERELFSRQVKVFVLDDLGFTDSDRSEQARRAGEVARLFQLAGLVVIVALVSPCSADWEYARTLVGDANFTLVHLEASPALLRESVDGAGARILESVLQKIGWAPAAPEATDRVRPVPLTACPPTPRRRGFCVWLTGLSGAGKSTIAQALNALVMERGREVTFLDGDVVRTHLSKGLGFSRADRDANVKRIAFVAAEVVRHDGIVVCAVMSPYESTREECRKMIGADRFVLVHVNTPLAVCEERDPKGLYASARRGEIRNFTGIDDPYEPPTRPDLVLTTTDGTPGDDARMTLCYLEQRGLLAETGGS
jgi:adenylyl-sulfate kinase